MLDKVDRGVVQYYRALRCRVYLCIYHGALRNVESIVDTGEAAREGGKRQQGNKCIVIAKPKLYRCGTTNSLCWRLFFCAQEYMGCGIPLEPF